MRQALADCGLEPEPFAALLVKMSTAVVRESLGAEIDLAEQGRQADRAVASLCGQLDGLDGDPRLSPAVRNARAELLSAVLKESVAYREFVRLLEDVPAESVAAVARRADLLRRLMPATETLTAFEEKLKSQGQVMRASYEAPGRVSGPP